MITFSIIQKSQLEGAHRLDAEYYQPEYLIDFSKGKWKPIGEISEICQYGLSKAMNEDKNGFPIFKMNDIKDAFLVDEELKYADISKELFNQFKLQKNDVLFNRVNAEEFVGRTGIFKLDGSYTFASYLVKLKVRKNSHILPDYLNLFLNSSFGIKQIRRYRRRAVNQANVNAEELKKIKIAVLPLTFQKEIREVSDKIWSLLVLSKSLYSQAENLFLEELGLKDFKPKEDLAWVVNLSDVQKAKRIDAEFFQPKYMTLISKIKNKKSKFLALGSLEDFFSIRRGDFIDPHYYINKAKRGYIRIKELPTKGDINLDSIIYIKEDFINKNLETLLEGDFVFAGIGATLGKTARIPKELEGSFYSNNTVRFRVKEKWQNKIDTYYLQVLFQTIVCHWQFEQRQAQTAQAKIADQELKTVILPILPKPTQRRIAELVRKSHAARQKSKQLLKQAKKRVESLIEMGNK